MLIPLMPIHACMHATKQRDGYQICFFTHTQKIKIGKPPTTSTSHLNKYKQQNPKNEL